MTSNDTINNNNTNNIGGNNGTTVIEMQLQPRESNKGLIGFGNDLALISDYNDSDSSDFDENNDARQQKQARRRVYDPNIQIYLWII